MNGVTPYGFVKMRLPEIRQAIAADLKNRLVAAGLDGNIETRPCGAGSGVVGERGSGLQRDVSANGGGGVA